MIKEILQESNNKSLSKEKINNNKINSVLYGLNSFKKLKLIKKSKQIQNLKKNKNRDLFLNQNENLYTRKATNLKTVSVSKRNTQKKSSNNKNIDKTTSIEKRINHTSREILRNNKLILEEEKTGVSYQKNLYAYKKNNYNKNKLNNLDKEFEIRCLKNKLEKLKSKNDSIKLNLEKIKEKNERLNYEKIKKRNNNTNILVSIYNIYNIFFENNKKKNGNKIDLKKLLLDLMELKYDYGNKLLINTFYKNLEEMIQISSNFNRNDIYSNIKFLIESKNEILEGLNKFNDNQLNSKKYYQFCTYLCNDLDINNLDDLYNYLINLKSSNENEIRKIIKMRSLLFSPDIPSKKRLNTNISSDKLKKNRISTRDLIYSDLKNLYNKQNDNNDLKTNTTSTKKRIQKNNECLTERNILLNNHDLILNLKSQSNYKNVWKKSSNNDIIDKEKINKFLYSSKEKIKYIPNKKSNLSNSFNYNYQKKESNKFSNIKKSNYNLNTASTNITLASQKFGNIQNYTSFVNDENENILNLYEHKNINFNECIKNTKIYSRIPSLKKRNNYHPIYKNK